MLVFKCLFWASALTFLLEINVIIITAVNSTSYDSVYACDGKMLKIECSEGFVINLIRANYGRYSITVCNDRASTQWSVNCMSHTSFPILRTLCQQKRNCSIQANASLFDDPCPETVKYLEAHYTCIKDHLAPHWLITSSRLNLSSIDKSLTIFLDTPVTPIFSVASSSTTKTSSSGLEKYEDDNISCSTPNILTTQPDEIVIQNDEKLAVCKPENVRNLFWNYSKEGDVSTQPCPGGASGIARWRCQAISKDVAIRSPDTPDLSDCKSDEVISLNNRFMDGEAITKIASDLSQVTESKTLYGGDVVITCKLIRDMVQKMSKEVPTFPDARQREDVVFDLLRSVVRISSHLLDSNTLASWYDLASDEQIQTASLLLVALEENSFILATALINEHTITFCAKNIVLQLQVLETRDVADTILPVSLSTKCRIKSSNYVQLQKKSLLENSQLEFVRVLYIAFDGLENILKSRQSSMGKDEKRINSKIFSVSFGRGNHVQLNQPVTLCFEHLQTENVGNVSCVIWDRARSVWSEDGCALMSTNKTHTTCQYNYLSNFAVLADVKLFNYNASNARNSLF